MNWIFFAFFLQNVNCPYLEIEGESGPFTFEKPYTSDILSGKYYWFEFENKVFLLHFNNKLETHGNPFLLFISIMNTKEKRWYEIENNQLLLTAFNNFQKSSTFVSLMQNKQNRNRYKFVVDIYYDLGLHGEISY